MGIRCSAAGMAFVLGCLFWGPSVQAGVGFLFGDPLDTGQGIPGRPAEPWQGRTGPLPELAGRVPWSAAQSDRTWTLPELTAFALSHNPQTAAAWEGLRAQAAAVGVTESAWLPTLTLGGTATRRQAVSTAGFRVPARNSAYPNLTLSYTLWDFGLRHARYDQAEAQEWVAGFTQNQTLQTVVFSVTQAYYQLMGSRALLEADARTVAEDRKALEAAEVLHRAGQATIGDLYQARAALAQAESTHAGQKQTVLASQGTLANTLGLAPGSTIHIVPLTTGSHPPAGLQDAARRLMRAAETANPALQEARAQVAAARASVRAVREEGLPSLGVTGTYGYQFQGGFQPGDSWTLGFTLTVPLFTGFSNHYQVRQAEATARQDEATMNSTRNSTLAAVWQDYHSFRGDLAAYPGASSSLANAGKALEVVIAQYRVGQATIQDLLQAESALAQSRYSLISNLVSSYVALAQLDQAVGMPVGEAHP